MNAALASEISRLTPAEKLQLVGDLWNDLAASEDRLPIPSWHEDLLAEDQAHYDANPTEGAPWLEVIWDETAATVTIRRVLHFKQDRRPRIC